MKTPLDCQLLTLGMKFVECMKSNDADGILKITDEEKCGDDVKSLISNEVYRSVMANLTKIHAMVKDPDMPRLFLEFCVNETEKLTHLIKCSIQPNEKEDSTIFITGIISRGEIGTTICSPRLLQKNGLSGFDMLQVVVPFTIADAICDTDYAINTMSEDVEAFGKRGREIVIAFKNEELAAQKLLDLPAYKLEDPFEVNFESELVELGFECVMDTKPGLGTDYVSVNSDKLVCKINAVRH